MIMDVMILNDNDNENLITWDVANSSVDFHLAGHIPGVQWPVDG